MVKARYVVVSKPPNTTDYLATIPDDADHVLEMAETARHLGAEVIAVYQLEPGIDEESIRAGFMQYLNARESTDTLTKDELDPVYQRLRAPETD